MTLPGFLKMQVKVFSDDHIDNGITKKLQSFIILVTVTTVRQRQQQSLWIPELIAYSCWKRTTVSTLPNKLLRTS